MRINFEEVWILCFELAYVQDVIDFNTSSEARYRMITSEFEDRPRLTGFKRFTIGRMYHRYQIDMDYTA
jgi:hypothetical protein